MTVEQSHDRDSLTPKILKVESFTLAAPINPSNTSGWRAIDDKILVLPYQVVTETAGGIVLPDVVTVSGQWYVVASLAPHAEPIGPVRIP